MSAVLWIIVGVILVYALPSAAYGLWRLARRCLLCQRRGAWRQHAFCRTCASTTETGSDAEIQARFRRPA